MRIKSPYLLASLAFGFASAMWILFRTLRMRVSTLAPKTNPYESTGDQRFVYCVWHDSIVIPVFGGRHRRTTALTSHHSDGSFVEEVLKYRHVSAIRGSTNRITTGAIRKLMQQTETQHIVITPDGPRGPARQMSPGIAYLASRTGRAVVPTAFACSRSWRIRGSWTDLIVPQPFARVVLVVGAPIWVPAALSAEELRDHVLEIQTAMDDLNDTAENEIRPKSERARGDQLNPQLPAVPDLF